MDKQRLGCGLSRRAFMAQTTGLATALGAATTIDWRARSAFADDTVPRKGGTLRLGMAGGNTADSLDPTTYTDSVVLNIGYQLMNGMIEIDAHNQPQPELLESWDVRPGAREWVFNVRKDVVFHNGKTLDADDIIYSLNLHRGESKSPMAGPMKNVADIKKLGSHQIAIALTSGDADFLYTLGDFHLLAVPNGFKDFARPIGTGAFVFEAFEPGVRSITKHNPNYWKQGHGFLDAVELTVINDVNARMNALLTGQVDAINRVDKKTIALLKNAPQLGLVQAPGGWHTIISMVCDQKPFDNKDMRLALKHAIDREQLLKTLFNGYGSVGNDHPIPRSDPFYNDALPQTAYDPEKAKFHFKKAGVDAARLTLSASDAAFNGAVDMAVLFKASAEKAGIAIDIRRESPDGFWSDVWLKAPFVTSYWAGRAAATDMLTAGYLSGAAWNETHWRNPTFDKLLADAKSETDIAKRKNYIWEMQRMLHEDGGAIIPVFSDWVDGHNKKVRGHTPHSMFDMCNGRIGEKVWLET